MYSRLILRGWRISAGRPRAPLVHHGHQLAVDSELVPAARRVVLDLKVIDAKLAVRPRANRAILVDVVRARIVGALEAVPIRNAITGDDLELLLFRRREGDRGDRRGHAVGRASAAGAALRVRKRWVSGTGRKQPRAAVRATTHHPVRNEVIIVIATAPVRMDRVLVATVAVGIDRYDGVVLDREVVRGRFRGRHGALPR